MDGAELTAARREGTVVTLQELLTLAQSISTLWAGVGLDQLALSVQEVLRWTALISLAAGVAWVWFLIWSRARRTEMVAPQGVPENVTE